LKASTGARQAEAPAVTVGRGSMMLRRWLRVAVPSLAALCGCDQNQCPATGQTTCEGAQILLCSKAFTQGTYLAWGPDSPNQCPNYCVEINGQENCSLTADPVPECARDGDGCWQGSPVSCLGGFPLESLYGPNSPRCDPDAGETCVNGSPNARPSSTRPSPNIPSAFHAADRPHRGPRVKFGSTSHWPRLARRSRARRAAIDLALRAA
jgi:hypothetical protein